ncbi:hypothetical protein JHD50_10115 [Sulfurimonas sp. MAG313]|nr:hypothetical protein [Sulfurimonas sp. MAG313]MDF1881652.1 hypothetical protein [Sulfurimonas sp. MAG313]
MKSIFVLVMVLSQIAWGLEFQGTGFGKDMKEAKYEALADLSQSIKSEVHSSFISHKQETKNSAQSFTQADIKVSSNLPILGAQFELFENEGIIEALVRLPLPQTKILYTQKLQSLYKEIQDLNTESKVNTKSEYKEKILKVLLNRLKEYDRYRSVALVLGLNEMQNPEVNKAFVEVSLLALEDKVDTLDKGINIIAKEFIKYKNIYLYPPKQSQSHEVTPFAKSIKMKLQASLSTSLSPSSADYWLIGEYSESDKGIVLSYTLVDVNKRENIAANTVSFPLGTYKGLRTKPSSLSFDKLLHEGIALSNDFKVAVSTNKGTEDLLFLKDEEIDLTIKLNKMGYYYIVGYTQNKSQKRAYLLELEDAPGNAKFIKFVNADDANKWINLGSFVIEEPFGIESIQVIASNKKIKILPKHYYDEKSGYFFVGQDMKKGLASTRGLIRKKDKDKQVLKAEAVLTFTTMKK